MSSIPGSQRFPGGGHGYPLQCSCLENPMDRGAWRATVHRVIESRTRLKRLSTVTCIKRKCHIVLFFWFLCPSHFIQEMKGTLTASSSPPSPIMYCQSVVHLPFKQAATLKAAPKDPSRPSCPVPASFYPQRPVSWDLCLPFKAPSPGRRLCVSEQRWPRAWPGDACTRGHSWKPALPGGVILPHISGSAGDLEQSVHVGNTWDAVFHVGRRQCPLEQSPLEPPLSLC